MEDFSDGEAIWKRLMASPTFDHFLIAKRQLTNREKDLIVLYHAIKEKQGEGVMWPAPGT
jgi:hypothetical protein